MNDRMQKDPQNDHDDLAEWLSETAESIQPDTHFAAELEKNLIMSHMPETHHKPSPNKGIPAFGWIAATALFALLLIWSIRNLIPHGEPAAGTTQTPSLQEGNKLPAPEAATPSTDGPIRNYPFRGGNLNLTAPLPAVPSEANVYLLKREEPITAEDARRLAEQFGIQGEVYVAQDLVNKYVVTDGKKSISIASKQRFFYTSDLVKFVRNFSAVPNGNAESIIRDFLKSRGIDMPFSISIRELFGGYVLQQNAPDGLPMQYEYFSSPVMRVTLDENDEVLSLDANWMEFDPIPVGTYGIISAEDALTRVLDDNNLGGKIESVHSGGGQPPQTWNREYADGQMVSIYGSLMVAPAVDSSLPPLLLLDGTLLTGDTSGLESFNSFAFIKATGQYFTDNGIRKFQVASWDANASTEYVLGSLRREGDQIRLSSDDGVNEYILLDPPADLPLNTPLSNAQLSVSGVIADGKLDWTTIMYYPDASQMGGGGGGSGLGFHQLNLDGPPVPFPTPTPVPFTLPSPAISRMDGTRGMLNITLYSREDGTVRTVYGFLTSGPAAQYFTLNGNDLGELRSYNNKPVEIWGTVEGTDEFGSPEVSVERYNLPFPDLKPRIFTGKENEVELEGKPAVLITVEDGTTYVEFMPGCNDVIPVESLAGTKGSNQGETNGRVMMEALAVPDLVFAGYPGLCVFSAAPATQPDGSPFEMTITSDQLNELPEPPPLTNGSRRLTVDTVELIYYASNPNTPGTDPGAARGELYIQPAWHFHGHYDNGDEWDVIVQALNQEYLSPELAPYLQGG